MEASVATPAAVPEPAPTHDGQAEATRSTEQLFQWSGYVHVGGGAADCEHGIDGECDEPEHFHGWICLPNAYQIRDIGDKARAARARKARALRDAGTAERPPSDSYVILESELDTFRQPENLAQLIQAIARRTIERQLIDILDDLQKDDRFAHHGQDAEEFQRLQALPEDQRDAEEFERLQEDMLAYGAEMQKEIEERVAAEVVRLTARTPDEVIDVERQFRIDDISNETYLHTYYTWSIYTGTRKPTAKGFPSERTFADPGELTSAPPEVIQALREKIRELEDRTMSRGEAAGNS